MSTLTIISHTEHYRNPDGTIVGLGSTITEINHLLDVFDEIYHVAMLHNCSPLANTLPYTSDKIKFVPLPAVGGSRIKDKLTIVFQAFKILKTISATLKQSDYFQFRAPTGIGVFVIPYLVLFSTKKGWFKYAGNWNQKNAPLAYRFQKWMLKKQQKPVTINGNWPNQPRQCLTFENPCLTNEEVVSGQTIMNTKSYDSNQISFCFVGRLEEEKGIGLLIKAFNKLSVTQKLKIHTIHIVGDGKAKNTYVNMTEDSDLKFVFHGFLSRTDVQNIYKESQVIVLPSASEGFPKVIAEAMNFGCIPVVSNVSGISNYIKNGKNGFLLDVISIDELVKKLQYILTLSHNEFYEMMTFQGNDLNRFTYTFYNQRISSELLV